MRSPWCPLSLLVLVSMLSSAPAVLAQRRPIFLDSAEPGEPDRADEAVTRSRFVRVSARNLREGAQAAVLELNLFPDRALRARLQRVDDLRTHTVYFGRLEGREEGEALLVAQDGILTGTIRGGGKLFQIRFAGRGVHEIQEIDPSLLPAEDEPLEALLDAEPAFDAMESAAVETAADDGSLIDVLVAYTPAARAGAGGTSAMQALINLAVAETNQAYANSGVIQRVRLAGTAELAYTESGSFSDDLNRFRNPSDGYMDQVHALRDSSGADLVHLIAESGSSCGIGYVMSDVSTSFASFAFAVTKRSCISNLTFAHEIGHNMGLQHDRYVNQSNSPYAYSHGYVNQAALAPGALTNKRWRTVMAYNDECAAAGFGCTRILYFSDPARTYTGDPLGIPGTGSTTSTDGPANERLSLDSTRTTVANFRTAAEPAASSPAKPATISPTGNVSDTTPTFVWSAVAGATNYRLWVQKGTADVYNLTYSSTAAGCASGPTCSATPAAVLALAAHTFRVRAINSSGTSSWSDARAFTVTGTGETLNGFDSQFNTSMSPWQAHSGSWSILSNQQLHSQGVAGKYASVSYPTSFTNLDYRVRFSRTGTAPGNPTYLMIRGNPTLLSDGRWSQGYTFQITQNGSFSVLRNSKAIKAWTTTAALNRGSAWNELRVVATGPNLSFYINGTLVWSGTDATLPSGRVGIGFYRGSSTTGNAMFVDYATLGSSTTTTTSVPTTTTSVPTTTTSVPTTTTTVPTTTTTVPTTTTTVRPTTTTTATVGGPDVSVTKTDSPDPVKVGQSVTYTLTVRNNGPGTASSVQLTDIHPSSLQFLGSDPGCSPASATQVLCNLGSMQSGATISKRIYLRATATGILENSATVFFLGDPNMSNNVVRITTQVVN